MSLICMQPSSLILLIAMVENFADLLPARWAVVASISNLTFGLRITSLIPLSAHAARRGDSNWVNAIGLGMRIPSRKLASNPYFTLFVPTTRNTRALSAGTRGSICSPDLIHSCLNKSAIGCHLSTVIAVSKIQ